MTIADYPGLSDLINRSEHIVQDAYRTGYKAGYQAAMGVLMDAAKAAAQFPIDKIRASPVFYTDEANRDVSDATPTTQPISPELPQTSSGRAAPGSIKGLVRTFVMSAGRPVTEAEFAERYPDVLRPSRYMAFRTLGQEGVIVKEDGRWVPASKNAVKSGRLALDPDETPNLGEQL